MKMSSTGRRRFGKALAITLPALGLTGVSAIIVAKSAVARSLNAAAPEVRFVDFAPRSMAYEGELEFLGLTPEAFAAAGIAPRRASEIIRLLASGAEGNLTEFASARARHAAAQDAYEQKAALVRSGRGDAGDAASAAQKHEYAAACLADCHAAERAALGIVRAALRPEQSSLLDAIRANAEHDVPLPYAATELTEAERLRLRDALVLRRLADRDGRALDAEARAFLDSLDSRREVIAAANGMKKTAEVQQAFRAALDALSSQ